MGGNAGGCMCVFTKHAWFRVKRLEWVTKNVRGLRIIDVVV